MVHQDGRSLRRLMPAGTSRPGERGASGRGSALHAVPPYKKRNRPVVLLGIPVAVFGVIAGALATFLILPGGPSSPGPAAAVAQVSDTGSAASLYEMSTSMHRDAAVLESRM